MTDEPPVGPSNRGRVETTVVRAVNDHGGMVVQTPRGLTLHLVEYADERIVGSLSKLRPGDGVTLRVERLEGRGSCFRVTDAVAPPSGHPKA